MDRTASSEGLRGGPAAARAADAPSRDADAAALPALASRALLWPARHPGASPFLEHLPLVFWAMEVLRPRRVVHLGAGDPVPFLALCQAIDALGLAAPCRGLDPEAGAAAWDLGPYEAFARLEPGDPDDPRGEAVARGLEEGSVDLLHVGRAPEGPAAAALERAWAPRLSERAVVLLGGAAGAGAFAGRPSFALPSGGGLRLALAGGAAPEPLRRLCAPGPDGPERAAARRLLERLGRAHRLEWRAAEEARAAAAEAGGALRIRLEAAEEAAARRDMALAEAAIEAERALDRAEALEGLLDERHREIAALVRVIDRHDRRAGRREESRAERAERRAADARAREKAAVRREAERLDRIAALEAEREALAAEAEGLRASRDAILASTAWRATARARGLIGAVWRPGRSASRG